MGKNYRISTSVLSVSLLALSSQVSALPDLLNYDLSTQVIKTTDESIGEVSESLSEPLKLSKIVKRKRINSSEKKTIFKEGEVSPRANQKAQVLKPVKINSKPVKVIKQLNTISKSKKLVKSDNAVGSAGINKQKKSSGVNKLTTPDVTSKLTTKVVVNKVVKNRSVVNSSKSATSQKAVVAKKTINVSKPIKISKSTIVGESTRVGKTTRKDKSEWITKVPETNTSSKSKRDKFSKAVKVTKTKNEKASKVSKSSVEYKATSVSKGKLVSKPSTKSTSENSKTINKKSVSGKTKLSKTIDSDTSVNPNYVSRLNKSYKSKATINAKPKVKKKASYSLGGQITIKDNLDADNPTLSASASWKPDASDFYYIKAGLKHSFKDGKEDLTYSWGVGYDDWHEGTITTQINHWGGIEKGEGLDIDNAFFSIGYKVKSKLLKKYKLKSALTLAKQIGSSGKPSLTTSLSYSPKPFWSVKGILATPLDGGQSKWNYLFGYDDWHPGTFGFEYSNYAGSKLSETNFRKGDLAVFYKWKFK